jgi:hypothetical protein
VQIPKAVGNLQTRKTVVVLLIRSVKPLEGAVGISAPKLQPA